MNTLTVPAAKCIDRVTGVVSSKIAGENGLLATGKLPEASKLLRHTLFENQYFGLEPAIAHIPGGVPFMAKVSLLKESLEDGDANGAQVALGQLEFDASYARSEILGATKQR